MTRERAKEVFHEWLVILVSVFVLYQVLWSLIYNLPDRFYEYHDYLTTNLKFLGFNAIYCAGALFIAYRCVWFARKKNSLTAKIITLSSCLLLFNFMWSVAFAIIVTPLYLARGPIITYAIDTYALAVTSTMILSLLFASKYIKAYIREAELRNKEKDAAKDAAIRNLQLQISPHFLFNNLSTLSSLIDEDKHKAEDFLMHLSQFYRHTLQNIPNTLISISDELTQLEDYLALLRARFGSSVCISIQVGEGFGNKGLLPPGTIQLLVENCIKHNRFSRKDPLSIVIKSDETTLTVINDFRPLKRGLDSSKIGQENIKARYRLLDNQNVIIEHDSSHYSVTIPLITQK